MNAKSCRQILLTEPSGGGQHAQDSGVRRCEIEAGDPLTESHGGVRAYLGQQEGQWGFRPLHDIWLHFIIVYSINDYIMKPTSRARFAGPRLLPLAIVHTLLFVANVASAVLLRHGPSFVTPFGDAGAARAFFAANAFAVKVSAFFFFGSAVPLAIYTATLVSRLRYLGVRAAGTNIALFGGFAASGAIAISGLCTWVLSVPEVSASLVATRVLYFMSFLFGGTGFAVPFGLLAAGVSVTSHFARLLPRWLIVLGMIVAVAGELSYLSLIAYPANLAIPVTRFIGFAWLILVANQLTEPLLPTEAAFPEGATA
jgi:hypothetical protein